MSSRTLDYMGYSKKISTLANICSNLPSGLFNNYLNMEAIFSDCTRNFVSPCEPTSKEPVTIKIRVAKNNVDEVYLCCNQEISSVKDGKIPLTKSTSEGIFEYFEVTVASIPSKISYYFIIVKNGNSYFYNHRGLYDTIDENYNFTIIPDFKTPDWAKGALMYQLYVDRFYNGDKTNDVRNNEYAYLGAASKFISDWSKDLENLDICNFYGGDLQGVIDKMSYLKDLGIDVIYFNPIFVSPSNHKYDIQDYDYVDPHYGVIVEDGGEPLYFEHFHNKYATMYIQRTTNKANLEASNNLFCKLVSIAHSNGIKVILDGVFNHCGAYNKWLDRENFYADKDYPVGAYKSEDSIYNNYFKWNGNKWPDNGEYDSWWNHNNQPKLNYEESKELYEYMLGVAKKWISPPFNADGWRLDVAADLGFSKEFNHTFWRDFRKAVKEAKPDALILAEHYGDPKDWLQGDQWDSIMNYDAFMEPITWFLTGMQKHSEEYRHEMLCNGLAFENSMRYFMSRFSAPSLLVSMNELSNHDHSRFLTRTNKTAGRLHTSGAKSAGKNINKSIMYEAVMFQMTWVGAPTIYYGDEAGLLGWADPDNRRPYPWGREDVNLLNFHKSIIKIRKNYDTFKTGSVNYIKVDYGILCYTRFDEKNRFIIVLNNNEFDKELELPVWKANVSVNGILKELIKTENESFSIAEKTHKVENGILNLEMKPFSSILLMEV